MRVTLEPGEESVLSTASCTFLIAIKFGKRGCSHFLHNCASFLAGSIDY